MVQQTTQSSSTVDVWQVIQELGSNLDGTADKFTFRISTSKTNLEQFDFTIQNTRVYDKDTNTYISPCSPAGSSSNTLGGLTFSTTGVPSGFQDVTLDFSCRDYDFISGHKYLIYISNANNVSGSGGKKILFATTYYGSSGEDNFSSGGFRYTFDNGSCNPINYVWNSQTNNSGCNVWSNPKDDLYFVLTNTTPEPSPIENPVIFIPGIGGSELKTSQDIIWSADNGHGGTFSHAYPANEKIWVNEDEAKLPFSDDYFDILRLKEDGVTPEASLSLTGDLTSFGYPEIDSFFEGLGYTKGTNFFVFPYDWRLDVRSNKDSLDALVEEVKTKSGKDKVDIVSHSMGGLVARYYISDSSKAAKVNKLISLGAPHLGSVEALKTLMYGLPLGKPIFKIFNIGIAASETKDVFRNLPSASQLLPSSKYLDFYNNSDKNSPYPFDDERDIDNNQVRGILNFDQIKTLLTNLAHNMTVFSFGEQFHNAIDPVLNQSNGVKIYLITGSGQPTLGQIRETWWVTWPINLISKAEEIFINGDETVPLYSASLKKDSQDLSGAEKIYYVEQTHSDLVSKTGAAMQAVKEILNESNSLPVEVKDQKISLEGQHISVDNNVNLDIYDSTGKHTGLNSDEEVEVNIPNTFYSSTDNTKNIFVKKSAGVVTAKVTSSETKNTDIKIFNYEQDNINKTIFYNDVSINSQTTIQFTVDPNSTSAPTLTAGTTTIQSTSEISGSTAADQTSPSSSISFSGDKNSLGIYTSTVLVILTRSDTESGILKTEYSLDDGKTVHIYQDAFPISNSGKTTIQYRSIDKLGNEELPKTTTIELSLPNTGSSSNSNTSTVIATPDLIRGKQSSSEKEIATLSLDNLETSRNDDILGISTENLMPSAQLSENHPALIIKNKFNPILGGLLMISGGIVAIASAGLAFTFVKPTPK